MTSTDAPLAPPIFVGGTGRSGTTALARMLGLHSNIHSIRWESQFIVAQDGLLELAAAGYPEDRVDPFVSKLKDYWFRRVVNEGQPSEYEAGLCSDVTEHEIDEAISYFLGRIRAEEVTAMSESINRGLIDRIFAGATRRASAGRWCEKTPRSILYIGELADLYPGSTFIHIIRDGRDVAASMVSRQFWPVAASPHHPSMATFRGEITFEKALAYWETVLRLGRRSASTASNIRYIEIRLEDLAADPGGIVAYLLNELGEPMSHRMLRFDLSKSNVGRWAEDLTEEQRRYALEHHGQALLAEGYGDSPEDSRAPAADEELGRYRVTHEMHEYLFAPIPHKWRDPEDDSARLAMELGHFPDHSVLTYIDSVTPGGAIVDVGGHIGARAVFFGRHASSDGVVVVEPQEDRRRLAQQNITANSAGSTVALLDSTAHLTQATDHLEAMLIDADRFSFDDANISGVLSTARPRLYVRSLQAEASVAAEHLSSLGYTASDVSLGDAGIVEFLPDGAAQLSRIDLTEPGVLQHDESAGVTDDSVPGAIRGSSTLKKGQRSFYHQQPGGFRSPPEADAIPDGPRRLFVDAQLSAPDALRCSLFVVQYSGDTRTFTDRVRIHERTFGFVAIDPETTTLRLALRLGGPGTYALDRLLIHYA